MYSPSDLPANAERTFIAGLLGPLHGLLARRRPGSTALGVSCPWPGGAKALPCEEGAMNNRNIRSNVDKNHFVHSSMVLRRGYSEFEPNRAGHHGITGKDVARQAS